MQRKKYAVLIDGGFIRRKLGSGEQPFTANKAITFIKSLKKRPELAELDLYRIYYYDAEPLNSVLQNPITREKIYLGKTKSYTINIELIKALKREPYVAVRLGELNFRGWGLKSPRITKQSKTAAIAADDLKPDIVQKQVDMKIGLDIASLTLKNHVDIIALISADADFIPALKFARREGKNIFLYTLSHKIKEEGFYAHCDRCIKDEIPC